MLARARLAGAFLAVTALAAPLAACSGDDPTTSGGPVPTADELAGAVVSGDWTVTLTVDEQEPPVLDVRLPLGATTTRAYTITGGCNEDTVDCHVKRESAAGLAEDTWQRQGAELTFTTEAPVQLPCTIDDTDTLVDYTVRATFGLEIVDAQQVGDRWLATELAYTRSAELIPSSAAASQGCGTGSQAESGTAEPSTASPSTTAGPSATTGASATTGP